MRAPIALSLLLPTAALWTKVASRLKRGTFVNLIESLGCRCLVVTITWASKCLLERLRHLSARRASQTRESRHSFVDAVAQHKQTESDF
jgi:hypothetical protein